MKAEWILETLCSTVFQRRPLVQQRWNCACVGTVSVRKKDCVMDV